MNLKDYIKDKETAIKRTILQLDKLNEQRDKTFTFLEQGLYTPDIFTERSKKLSEQISDTESIIHKLNNDLKKLKEQANKNEVFIPKAEHILGAYEKLKSASAKNENLKEIIEKVEYVKTEPNRKGNRENPNFILNIYPRVIKF